MSRTGATDVLPFSHLVRRSLASAVKEQAEGKEDNETVAAPGPTMFAHLDQSIDGSSTVLESNVSAAELQRRKNSRWAILNIWRPLGRPVTRDPLALLDADTLDEKDLVGVMALFPDKKEAAFGKAYPGGQGYTKISLSTLEVSLTLDCLLSGMRLLKSLRTIIIDGITPRSSALTRRCCSNNLIRSSTAEQGRRRILLSSPNKITARRERACKCLPLLLLAYGLKYGLFLF